MTESRWLRRHKDPARGEACFARALIEMADQPIATRAGTVAYHAAQLVAGNEIDAALADCATLLAGCMGSDRVTCLDALASIPVFHVQARILLPAAARWCSEALRLSPEEITIRGTWGSLLYEEERYDEAITVLQDVLARTQSDRDRGIVTFYLAKDLRRRGQTDASAQLRGEALRLCKDAALTRRIVDELGAA